MWKKYDRYNRGIVAGREGKENGGNRKEKEEDNGKEGRKGRTERKDGEESRVEEGEEGGGEPNSKV